MASNSEDPDAEIVEIDYKDPGRDVNVCTAGPAFVTALAHVLTQLASLTGRPQRMTRFHAVRAPQLSIHDYLVRIATYFQCSHECFVLSLIYIDRIVKLHPEFSINSLSVHRLVVTSVMLAAKFFDDVYYSNAYYGKVGGVRTSELNALEILFLKLIEWRMHVLPEEYQQYRNHVLAAVHGDDLSSVGLPHSGETALLRPNAEVSGLTPGGYCQPGRLEDSDKDRAERSLPSQS
eukprot:TRINITY_DN49114_c0_g1_i1.p1 TRINITY_DN49114_c0_g1~~TRINITY_DN49114_c0_g1_i1.p1  ORF type:complete len:234 (+),score=41.07 TRINITY_DN49114_c0_g1_i1:91-792(+)